MRPRESVRTRHDEWVKRALSLWLEGLGEVQIDARIAGESRRGDVLYTERGKNPARRRRLGVLGELARGIVLFEPFRNPITARDLTGCVLKAVEHTAQRARAARRAKEKQSAVEPTMLCVITPSLSGDLAVQAEVTRVDTARTGIYRLAPLWRTVVFVADQLSEDASTLWLRLLGRGTVQARAVQELLETSASGPLRDATLELVVAWQQSLPPSAHQTEDEREMTINFERIYDRWKRKVKAEGEAEGLRKGKAEGLREGKARAVIAVLESRGLSMTAAQRDQVLRCADDGQLDVWLRAASAAASVDEVMACSAPADKKAGRLPRRAAGAATRNVRDAKRTSRKATGVPRDASGKHR